MTQGYQLIFTNCIFWQPVFSYDNAVNQKLYNVQMCSISAVGNIACVSNYTIFPLQYTITSSTLKYCKVLEPNTGVILEYNYSYSDHYIWVSLPSLLNCDTEWALMGSGYTLICVQDPVLTLQLSQMSDYYSGVHQDFVLIVQDHVLFYNITVL